MRYSKGMVCGPKQRRSQSPVDGGQVEAGRIREEGRFKDMAERAHRVQFLEKWVGEALKRRADVVRWDGYGNVYHPKVADVVATEADEALRQAGVRKPAFWSDAGEASHARPRSKMRPTTREETDQ